MGLFLRKNHLLRCWGWLSLLNMIGALTLSLLITLPPRKLEPCFVLWSFFLPSKYDWGSYFISIDNTASKKIGALLRSMKFLSPRLLCISINLPYRLAWNTVVTFGLVLLVANWSCCISYKNGFAGLFFLHLLPLFNLWLIFEM